MNSAVLIPVPAAEPVVGELRLRHDPSAAVGVPAHVTLLFPFVRAERISMEVIEPLRGLFVGVPLFDFELAGGPGSPRRCIWPRYRRPRSRR